MHAILGVTIASFSGDAVGLILFAVFCGIPTRQRMQLRPE
jgi:hypothetical protein